jgi:hypothetical protein
MITIAAAKDPDCFYVVCRECLWTPGRQMPWNDANDTGAAHGAECPGSVPKTATRAQINRARKLLSGDY